MPPILGGWAGYFLTATYCKAAFWRSKYLMCAVQWPTLWLGTAAISAACNAAMVTPVLIQGTANSAAHICWLYTVRAVWFGVATSFTFCIIFYLLLWVFTRACTPNHKYIMGFTYAYVNK